MIIKWLCILIGYAFGLLQTSYLYGRLRHIDIREHGSGNAGTTNMLRTLGKKAGIITFVGDVIKAVLAIIVTGLIFRPDSEMVVLLQLFTGLGVILGHNFPFYLGFRGGKGIASSVGVAIMIQPWIALAMILTFAVVILVSRYVSLGSLAMYLVFLVGVIVGAAGVFWQVPPDIRVQLGLMAVLLTILAFYQHRDNIRRLRIGCENKTNLFRKKQ
ncbi:MAG: glycerol-3-phosphate 1-O-acyltransferase PlsY [Lachnospiraceae bacterium]|nr:glycerol-3-phosphate 1-O-acyltransferase PlsY [Lachnospiraceae bacterium]MDY5741579.1 glycerol-3-phosphate 1-O-acyltransferase PlsY [Lachnospiraceae bacterium]